jgi:hypothetical protein
MDAAFLCRLPLGSQCDRFEQRSLLIVELAGIAQTDADGVEVAEGPGGTGARACDISAIPMKNAAIPPFTLCGCGRVT